MANIMDLFKVMLVVQLFYAFAITSLAYGMPEETRQYVTGFSDVSSTIDLESISGQVEESLESQLNIPVIELGALIFYSGNILIDLLLNFLFAIPQMIGMLINGLMLLINVDSYLFAVVELFASGVVVIMYFIGIIQLLTGIRSGRLV